MKIENTKTSKAGGIRKSGGTSAPSSTDFASELESENIAAASGNASTVSVSSAAAPATVSALLALQGSAVEGGDAGTARAKNRAEDLLQKLDQLRLDLLNGGIPRDRLIGLAHSLKSAKDTVFDPQLRQVLDDIDLRAQVELAKYDPYNRG